MQLRSHSAVDKPEESIEIDLTEPVSLTFSLKYLVNFCKASGLSSQVKLCLSSEVPLLVEYGLQNNSYLRFYLAPKVSRNVLLHSALANSHRLVTRSERFMTFCETRCVFKDSVGARLRNVLICMRMSIGFIWRY